MNVIIVLLDAVRAHNLGCYGYEGGTSPNIDEVAEESMLFENCFSQSSRTEPSLTTIMTGKHPLNHGVTHHGTRYTQDNARKLSESGTRFLAQILKSEGYKTMAIDWLGRWHRRGYDYYGISERENWKDIRWKMSNSLKKFSKILWEFFKDFHEKLFGSASHRSNCEKVTQNAINLIDDCEGDFFLFVHYWDVHAPYDPPEEHLDKLVRGGDVSLEELWEKLEDEGYSVNNHFKSVMERYDTLEGIKSAYDASIHWVDEQVGRLIDYLKSEGILEDTLLIITADHGEALGEHGIYFAHDGLYDHTIHVPLIIRNPGTEAKRFSNLVQLTDITPTVLDYLGLEKPRFLDGDILPDSNREDVYSEMNRSKMRSIRTKNWKYIHPVEGERIGKDWYKEREEELYNLSEDPAEEENLAEVNPDLVRKFKRKLDDKVKEFLAKREKGRIKENIPTNS